MTWTSSTLSNLHIGNIFIIIIILSSCFQAHINPFISEHEDHLHWRIYPPDLPATPSPEKLPATSLPRDAGLVLDTYPGKKAQPHAKTQWCTWEPVRPILNLKSLKGLLSWLWFATASQAKHLLSHFVPWIKRHSNQDVTRGFTTNMTLLP